MLNKIIGMQEIVQRKKINPFTYCSLNMPNTHLRAFALAIPPP